MKVELKNLKHSEFASHETNCFEATVWLNGKRAFFAQNDGHGGGDSYAPLENQDRGEFTSLLNDLINHCLTLPKWGSEFGGEDNMDVTPEILIGNLINTKLLAKDLKRKLKKKVLYLTSDGLYENSYKVSKPVDQFLLNIISEKNPDAIILNSLAFDEALEIYEEQQA